jgi:hypothetical protein
VHFSADSYAFCDRPRVLKTFLLLHYPDNLRSTGCAESAVLETSANPIGVRFDAVTVHDLLCLVVVGGPQSETPKSPPILIVAEVIDRTCARMVIFPGDLTKSLRPDSIQVQDVLGDNVEWMSTNQSRATSARPVPTIAPDK